ncbi:hypothetical protein BHM03_00040004 [Ensete ventricosum]|nr:hypothetical protein BHM03_00040004 [Ensete ventricosum]
MVAATKAAGITAGSSAIGKERDSDGRQLHGCRRRHRQHGWQRKKRATVATLLYAVILQQRRVLLGGATGNRWLETATAATNVGEGKKIRKRV